MRGSEEVGGAAAPEFQAIKTVMVVIAMQAEAVPLVEELKLVEDSGAEIFPKGVPWRKYSGGIDGLKLHIVVPGKDKSLGVDSVGTVPASLLTYAAALALQPDLIINAGTAGGFQAKGACIGDVFVATEFANHDRRIPIPVFDKYGVGTIEATPFGNLVKDLNLKEGKVSTGNSLDMTPQDEEHIRANDASVKDMEVSSNFIGYILVNGFSLGTVMSKFPVVQWYSRRTRVPNVPVLQGAAIAYVADLLSIPLISLKAVTDIVDGTKPTVEEFLENMSLAASALARIMPLVLKYITGKSLSDLYDS